MGKVLHASYSGHFPFCVKQLEDDPAYNSYIQSGFPPAGSPGSYYPIGLSIYQAMRLFWIIRKMRLKTLFNGDTGENFTYFESQESTTPVSINEEQEIICMHGGLYTAYIKNISISESATEVVNPVISIGSFLKLDDLYYPLIAAGSSAFTPSNAYFSATFNDPGYSLYESGVCNFFGFGEIALYTYTDGTLPYPFDFVATEYWSYDNTYDTATGASL